MQPYSSRQAEQIFNVSYSAIYDALEGRDNEQRYVWVSTLYASNV